MNVGLAAGSVVAIALVLGAIWFSTTGTTGILEGDAQSEAAPEEGEPIEFTVAEGESVSQIADRLEEAGIIDSALRFRVLASFTGRGEAIRSGDYQLQPGEIASTVLETLTTAPEEQVITLTIPEGWRIEEMADRVAEEGIATREEFIAAASRLDYDFDFVAAIPEGVPNLEGYLFPDTYEIAVGATAETVVLLMLQNFDRRVTDEMRAGYEAQGLTLHEGVTLAS
ncbi:MAG TPA: endolytic transglycosylase MltG, partial [Dehalococcoidia bacterium]|nr:endolytic transglycosylase MltG [Dehalococcoidia bacterium]